MQSKKTTLIVSDFISKNYTDRTALLEKGTVSWKTPSNIALIKYWGKSANQIPANASISLTLSNCNTITSLEFERKKMSSDSYDFDVFFQGKKKESFYPKVGKFFERVAPYIPMIKDYKFLIHTNNTFPHSSGIASSASGFGAIALCLMSLEKKNNPNISDNYFHKKASFLARLGSGSSCRSIKGGLIVWGKHNDIENSSDLYGIEFPYKIDAIFQDFQDTILIVDNQEKEVSSSIGHSLMVAHPFAQSRFLQANDNLSKIKNSLIGGDINSFIKLVETEALTLHAMMMTSSPYFILMNPNTLKIIHKVWEFRKNTNLHLCFTLDAGANIHLLYPNNEKEKILNFIKSELLKYCHNKTYICDQVGKGSILLL